MTALGEFALIERFFSKLKHFRRIATRYDKLAENFLAMVEQIGEQLRFTDDSGFDDLPYLWNRMPRP